MRKLKKSTIAIMLLLVFAMSSLTVYAATTTNFSAYFTGQTLGWQTASANIEKDDYSTYAYLRITSSNHTDGSCEYDIRSSQTQTSLINATVILSNTNRDVQLLTYKVDVGAPYTGYEDLVVRVNVFPGTTLSVKGEWNPCSSVN